MELLNFKINKKILICLSSVILALSLCVILFINLTSSKKESNASNKISILINNYNKGFDDLINSSDFNSDKAIDALNDNNLKLESLKNSFKDINIDSNLKSTLEENITYNLSINSLCISLLKNPQAQDFTSKYSEYLNTYNMLLDNYSDLKSAGINIEISDSAKQFFEYSSKYFNTLLYLNRDKDIKVSQKSNYILSLQDCLKSFDKINEDLQPALNKIREDNRSLDNLLKDVRDKKSVLNEIKNTTYCISIPESGNECFNLLQDTINYYELYITSLEHSIVIEKTSDCEDNRKNIEENYENSFSKFQDFQDSLKKFKLELDSFSQKS